MEVINREFLTRACVQPWQKIEIGGVDALVEASEPISANHVFVDGGIPFLIAATSIESASAEELFSVTVIEDAARIRTFREGPYPPYNRPRTVSAEKLFDANLEAFMKARKHFRIRSGATTIIDAGQRVASVETDVSFEACGIALQVSVSNESPMGLQVRVHLNGAAAHHKRTSA